VELEVRNISQQALDAPVLAILTVTPAWDDEPSRQHWSIASSVDPTTGQFDGLYAERPSPPLRLPIRGSTRVRIDLDSLKWSLTPDLNVWRPRQLWELAEPGDYDVVVFIHLVLSVSERQVVSDSAWSAPARVRVVRR
jgi:hypothetical protein